MCACNMILLTKTDLTIVWGLKEQLPRVLSLLGRQTTKPIANP